MPHDIHRFLYPEAAHPFEQSCLYPTKRALMLVSKAWSELAVEFMYESLVIDHFGVGRQEQVFTTLEGSASFVFKKWVKRVDIFRRSTTKDYVCERLARIGLPNIRVQNMFSDYHVDLVPLGNLLPERPLHHVEACRSPTLDRLTSRGDAFGSLRCLTLWVVKPLPTPFHLPSTLRRLTIICYDTEYLRVQNIFSTRDALPNLTHLTLHEGYQGQYQITWFMEVINHIGPQLRHLSVTTSSSGARDWTRADLRTILCVCTQLTELVIPSPLAIWNTDPGGYGHSTLQTLGIPGWSELDGMSLGVMSTFDIFSRREAFPKLGTIRLVLWRGEWLASPWLAPFALRLRGHGIQLENCSGHPLALASVLDHRA
jgi:hypothetical protein